MDDAALIDEYLQWRSIRELTPVDTTPQAFMQDRVKEIAVDRLTAAMKYIDIQEQRADAAGTILTPVLEELRQILEGTDGQGTDREDTGQKPDEGNTFKDWEKELLRASEPGSDQP